MGHQLVHAAGIWGKHGNAQQSLISQVRVDSMSGVQNVDIPRFELPKNTQHTGSLVQIARRIIDLNQFHSDLNTKFLLLQLRERLLQIQLRAGDLPHALFTHAEQRLYFRQPGPKF